MTRIKITKNHYEGAENTMEATCKPPKPPKPVKPCPQLPGTLVRIFIPAGAVINLLNLIEITSPAGICLIVRLPFLGGRKTDIFSTLTHAIEEAGGTLEFVEE